MIEFTTVRFTTGLVQSSPVGRSTSLSHTSSPFSLPCLPSSLITSFNLVIADTNSSEHQLGPPVLPTVQPGSSCPAKVTRVASRNLSTCDCPPPSMEFAQMREAKLGVSAELQRFPSRHVDLYDAMSWHKL
ncbi:hypothetical protein Mapa_014082 [Marchantia paleacea]|nr:hypothetical protein Mapa_014082 [Marchantia paleacea]